jgi:hypothetical protein
MCVDTALENIAARHATARVADVTRARERADRIRTLGCSHGTVVQTQAALIEIVAGDAAARVTNVACARKRANSVSAL